MLNVSCKCQRGFDADSRVARGLQFRQVLGLVADRKLWLGCRRFGHKLTFTSHLEWTVIGLKSDRRKVGSFIDKSYLLVTRLAEQLVFALKKLSSCRVRLVGNLDKACLFKASSVQVDHRRGPEEVLVEKKICAAGTVSLKIVDLCWSRAVSRSEQALFIPGNPQSLLQIKILEMESFGLLSFNCSIVFLEIKHEVLLIYLIGHNFINYVTFVSNRLHDLTRILLILQNGTYSIL